MDPLRTILRSTFSLREDFLPRHHRSSLMLSFHFRNHRDHRELTLQTTVLELDDCWELHPGKLHSKKVETTERLYCLHSGELRDIPQQDMSFRAGTLQPRDVVKIAKEMMVLPFLVNCKNHLTYVTLDIRGRWYSSVGATTLPSLATSTRYLL
ncbi:hypothetical protein QCA50_005988 [Cerrena zonata]|uniref:Uncharacterized protein n=1 Tax=Cerrena zonata TaxID=2478898 RepID=A0AAW0GMY8_9APHY